MEEQESELEPRNTRKEAKKFRAHTKVTKVTEEIFKLSAPYRLPISRYLLNHPP